MNSELDSKDSREPIERRCAKREWEKAGWTRSLRGLNLAFVSKPTKAAATQGDVGKEMPFEEALKKLESIVGSMESDELPLETLLARFEEGTRLTRICQAKLAEAELKIQQLEKNAAGELTLRPATLAGDSARE